MIRVLLFLSIACAVFGYGEGHKAKKSVPAKAPGFVCPDPEAKEGCKSYEELVKAKDKGLTDPTNDRYVCFRKNADVFFVIAFFSPLYAREWDDKTKSMMVANNATAPGTGYAETYRDGVSDSQIMPTLFFAGTWRRVFGNIFTTEEINFSKIDRTKDPDSGVTISSSQLSMQFKYQNTSNQTVVYNLTIQRSTGRFVESFQVESEALPFNSGTGRCIFEPSR